jgi:hypothetical protein
MNSPVKTLYLSLLLASTVGAGTILADESKPTIKIEHFDHDPGWEGLNNRIELKKVPTVKG